MAGEMATWRSSVQRSTADKRSLTFSATTDAMLPGRTYEAAEASPAKIPEACSEMSTAPTSADPGV